MANLGVIIPKLMQIFLYIHWKFCFNNDIIVISNNSDQLNYNTFSIYLGIFASKYKIYKRNIISLFI